MHKRIGFEPSATINTVAALAVGLFAAFAGFDDAKAQGGLELGVLTCNSIPGTRINLLIHSSVDIKCVFETPYGSEKYKGETGIGLGVDINWDRNETIKFSVIGAAADLTPGSHSLSGKFLGGKASVTAGYGAGAAALIGGGAKNFSLQPLALEGSTGIGVAAGLGYLYIEADTE